MVMGRRYGGCDTAELMISGADERNIRCCHNLFPFIYRSHVFGEDVALFREYIYMYLFIYSGGRQDPNGN